VAKRHEFEGELDLDDTVRGMRTLTDSPGEREWREKVADGFGGIGKRLSRIDGRLIRIEERQLSRINVADMIKTELKVFDEKLSTISRILWGSFGAIGAALVILAISRVFGQ
jgi:hypothetical protein